MNEKLISIIANLSLALSFIVALVFGIEQVRMASRDRRDRLTLDTLRNFQTREFAELGLYITERTMPTTREKMNALPLKEQVMIYQFSQQIESLGMLVAEELISIDLVDKTLGSFVTQTWLKYKPFFQNLHTHQDQPDPYIGEYFQWLAEYINERMKTKPRTRFYLTDTPAWQKHK